ncbi:MAG: VanZ family protein [Candidatus Portnoybacteria bacterium]|nr:VanZ family protein [Candidatus Portnoybacteria bacterium]
MKICVSLSLFGFLSSCGSLSSFISPQFLTSRQGFPLLERISFSANSLILPQRISLSFSSLLRLAFFLALLWAISDEYHQLFVEGREGTFRDVMIDAIGITLIPLYLTKNKRPQSMRSHKK